MSTVLSILRHLGAWLAGVVAGGVTVALVQAVGHMIWPPPEGLDPADPASIEAAMQSVPALALAWVVLAWCLGAFVAAALGTLLSKRGRLPVGLLAGSVTLLATVANLSMIPHPLWMVIAGIAGVILAMFAGTLAGMRVPVIGGEPSTVRPA